MWNSKCRSSGEEVILDDCYCASADNGLNPKEKTINYNCTLSPIKEVDDILDLSDCTSEGNQMCSKLNLPIKQGLFLKDENGDYINGDLILKRGKHRLVQKLEEVQKEIRKKDELLDEVEKKFQELEFSYLECKSTIISELESLSPNINIESESDAVALFKLFIEVIMEMQKQIAEMHENELYEKEDKIASLENRLSNLESFKNSLIEEELNDSKINSSISESSFSNESFHYNSSSDSIVDLKEDCSMLRKQCNVLKEKLEFQSEENKSLQSELDAKKVKLNEQISLYNGCKSNLDELEISYKVLLEENESLENEINKFKEIKKTAERNLHEAYQSITNLEVTLTCRNEEINKFKQKAETVQKRFNDLIDEYNELRVNFQVAQNDLISSKKQEEENSIYKDKYEKLQSELSRLIALIKNQNLESEEFTEQPVKDLINVIRDVRKEQDKKFASQLSKISDLRKSEELICREHEKKIKSELNKKEIEYKNVVSVNESLMLKITDLKSHLDNELKTSHQLNQTLVNLNDENLKIKRILHPLFCLLTKMRINESYNSEKQLPEIALQFLNLPRQALLQLMNSNGLIIYTKDNEQLKQDKITMDVGRLCKILDDVEHFITNLGNFSRKEAENLSKNNVTKDVGQMTDSQNYDTDLDNLKKIIAQLRSEKLEFEAVLNQTKSNLNYAKNINSGMKAEMDKMVIDHKNGLGILQEQLDEERSKNRKLRNEIRGLQPSMESGISMNDLTDCKEEIILRPTVKNYESVELNKKIEKLLEEKAFLKQLCRHRKTILDRQKLEITEKKMEIKKLQQLTMSATISKRKILTDISNCINK